MTDATRNDRPGPAAGPGGAQGALSGRLREARERFDTSVHSGSGDDFLSAEFDYQRLMFTMDRNGALERVVDAIEIEIDLGTASLNLRLAYAAMLRNVGGE